MSVRALTGIRASVTGLEVIDAKSARHNQLLSGTEHVKLSTRLLQAGGLGSSLLYYIKFTRNSKLSDFGLVPIVALPEL